MKRYKNKNNLKYINLQRTAGIFLLGFSVSISGCATETRPDEDASDESIAEYANHLFLRQNRASSTLMTWSEDELEPEVYEDLLEAEQEMHLACQSFNEYAILMSEGMNPGILLRNKVYRTLDNCDSATQELESLLEELD